jgi:tRNA pseudouridine55 synthase
VAAHLDGLLVVDKPAGPTSHDAVARVRRALGERRIGHTGTLDPAATGVLCLVLGRATRLAQFLSSSDKTYEAVVRFGFATDTGDADGRATRASGASGMPARDAVEAALDAFRGTFMQQPPAFSAKKIGGRRSHELARARARAGETGDRGDLADLPAPVGVTVHRLDIVGLEADRVTLRVHCSAGFYVRSLAHDLGERLGVGAHLVALRRTRSGDVTLETAIPLDAVERDPARAAAAIVPLRDVLPVLPVIMLSAEGVKRAINGCELSERDSVSVQPPASPKLLYRLVDPAGDLVAIARPSARPGFLHPAVVLM